MNESGTTFSEILKEFPKEQDCLITYIDLLGTKAHMQNNDDFFEDVYIAFSSAVVTCNKAVFFSELGVKLKIFSDNILIAYPIANMDDKDHVLKLFHNMEFLVRTLTILLLQKNILFRGAITVNKLTINDVMVWGPGLNEVVDLEEHIAIFPRIIFSDNAIELLKNSLPNKASFEKHWLLILDNDGRYCLDFFDYSVPQQSKELWANLKNEFTEKINTEKSQRVIQKYAWFLHYLDIVKSKMDLLDKNSRLRRR